MKKFVLSLSGMCITLALLAQDTTAQQEPSLNTKLQFWGLTIAGFVFLFLAYKRSKWGRKN